MKTNTTIFKGYPALTNSCYFIKACKIQNSLEQGIEYQKLGGLKLRKTKDLIRFKLGEYRLIFKRAQYGFIPETLIQRKNLPLFLKRR
ncbi:hypothetical protein Q4530_01095 [Colwellia sp. 1_MG-2023]|uniref:ParE family toxin-like protein n=1 Tax=unclassified Colwellia TaxID=196834 RepID=UPI001C0913C2|nr:MULTISPECIES: hypothetical protein [unclassified Colwellia]MBU2925810.1 hypothetical protein [Colwellia sp. C2M11]MDO6650963.1 hypothetical protein [Colwellia sp. 3_MG-2023]MDO6663998.1 hypothetical protein [Colwellia sp. 2_MG-2023]MDO6688349.1 hypothetical protein [Colwellia sp. 1_MG-2023]